MTKRYCLFGSSRLPVMLLVLACFLLSTLAWSQTTISTGSIQGVITDPSGAVVPDAKISIANLATSSNVVVTSGSSGTYSSGALIPGTYKLRIEAKGFETMESSIPVQVSVTTAGNFKLRVGEASQVVQVEASSLQVNTEQATVQGVLGTQQIENLPINGRNFLDLAQLEPGVQIQDGGNFDPTKNGFSSISFGGRFGRTARIEVDGIDISDETVGTTTQNIPQGAIQEFSIGQSSLDLSTELTSSGSVNVVTRSGSNGWHGEGFYLFRDHSLAAHLPGGGDTPFQRNQFGGRLGGPVIKNKLFFFLDAERIKQDLLNPVLPGGNFSSLTGGFNAPFRETNGIGRLDWNIRPDNFHFFYRFSYDQNSSSLAFIPNSFQPFKNHNNTPVHAVGLDFTTGSFTHSVRLGYTKFRNGIVDGVTGTNIFNPAPQLEIGIGTDPRCLTAGADPFCSGPNFLAPQATFQTDHQVKYDGSKTLGKHVIRYGIGFNHIQGGGFAKFLGTAPAVGSAANAALVGAFPGGAANPLNYPVQTVILGNGQGFATEHKAFSQPGGGLGPDNRFSWYIGDAWKIRPNITVTYGLRYVRDSGRTDSDIGPIPCSQLGAAAAASLAANGTTCTGNLLDLFGAGLGKAVRQPNANFAPQLGVAWDPTGTGKTVVRAGIGLFYENAVFNNVLFDRPARLQKGLFLNTQGACANGNPVSFTLPGTATVVTPTFCGQAIGNSAAAIAAMEAQYQAATLAAGPAVNGAFIGNLLADGANITGTNLYAPNYITPRSVQMNFGLQHEFGKGTVLSVDYLRNVATHLLLSGDSNHVGDARFLNQPAALAAIAATNNAFGCGAATSAAAINCAIAAGAKIGNYAGNGLDSGYSLCGGLPCSIAGAPAAAFAGMNPALGANQMLFPIGRSVYNGLQTSLRTNLDRPLPGIQLLNLQVSYSFSRYVSTARDNDFVNYAADYNNPTNFIGPNGLDRTHQLSFGGTFTVPHGLKLSVISHFYSPLPQNLFLPGGGIFVSDVTGDGTGDGTAASNGGFGDSLPGTNIGAFGRSVSNNSLNTVITNYNNTQAFQPTPAGQALISKGLFTLAQLQALGGVQQPVQLAPAGQVGMDWLRAFDLRVSWPIRIKERLTVEPSFGAFNLFNFANFDPTSSPLTSTLDGTPGSVNGTTPSQRIADRIGTGSGVFGQGAPRVLEFGMRITF